jgi:uncharacterized protein
MKIDLTNAELDELDRLLGQTPEPLLPLSVVGLDGYLCGVIVQPELIAPERWLPGVFDPERFELPSEADPAWLARVQALVMRRYEALGRGLAEDGWFDPVLYQDEPEDAAQRDALRELPPTSAPLAHWVAGFVKAVQHFPALASLDHADAGLLFSRLTRHLPPDDDAQREARAALTRDEPLPTLDDAIDDLVSTISALWELTQRERLRVDTVRRDQPKVGRNDPCPCGSGRKFKHCHGAA